MREVLGLNTARLIANLVSAANSRLTTRLQHRGLRHVFGNHFIEKISTSMPMEYAMFYVSCTVKSCMFRSVLLPRSREVITAAVAIQDLRPVNILLPG